MASLQEELKGVKDKIYENQKVEEALTTTTTELSTLQEEILSKSKLLELAKRLHSRDSFNQGIKPDKDFRSTTKGRHVSTSKSIGLYKGRTGRKKIELETARSCVLI